nr:hypothetical protein CFP56_27650 [Quercus suber]
MRSFKAYLNPEKAILSWFNHADGVCSGSYNEVPDISRLQYIASSIFMQDYTCRNQLTSHHVLHHIASKRWLCRLDDSIPADDEYRSSRNIAISLFKRFKNAVVRGGGDNLKEFISAGVNAYALGCTDEGLRKELNDLRESGVEIEAMQSYGGTTSLKSKIISEEVDECIFWLSIIFITIMCTPQPTIVRWSSTPPVSDELLHPQFLQCTVAEAIGKPLEENVSTTPLAMLGQGTRTKGEGHRSDIDDEIHDPWAAIKQFGPTSDSGTDGQTKFTTEGSFMESEFGFGNRKVKISNHKLTRKSLTGDCQDLVQGDAEV